MGVEKMIAKSVDMEMSGHGCLPVPCMYLPDRDKGRTILRRFVQRGAKTEHTSEDYSAMLPFHCELCNAVHFSRQ